MSVYINTLAVQVGSVVKKEYELANFMRQNLDHNSKQAMLQLCKTLVRSQLENCVQFWLPFNGKDMIELERVRMRFIRMFPGRKHFSYE